MKVRDLINELQKYDGDMEVRFMDYESNCAEEISAIFIDKDAVFREDRWDDILVTHKLVLLS